MDLIITTVGECIPFSSSFDNKLNSEFEMAASVAVGHFPSYMDQVLPRDINTCIGNVYVTKATL